MTRQTPTEGERLSGTALADFYRANGHSVSDVYFSDKPDLRLTIDAKAVGCECVQIPPARIFSFVHARFKQIESKHAGARAVQVVWPMEAHVWVREAIAEKDRLVPEYRRVAGVSEVSLLIHTPTASNTDVLTPLSSGEMNQIRWAAATVKTRFQSIYFFDPRVGVERVYPPSQPFFEPTYDFTVGYPTSGFVLTSVGPFTTTAEGAAPVDYDFGEVETQVLVVPPMDAQFRRYKPNYISKRYRYTVRAGSTTSDMTVHPIDEAP